MTKQYKVSDLEGALLDAAVAKAEGRKFDLITVRANGMNLIACTVPSNAAIGDLGVAYRPSFLWQEGGQIIARELIFFSELPQHEGGPEVMVARCGRAEGRGLGHLQSAMRAYVASKFGDTVALP